MIARWRAVVPWICRHWRRPPCADPEIAEGAPDQMEVKRDVEHRNVMGAAKAIVLLSDERRRQLEEQLQTLEARAEIIRIRQEGQRLPG